LDTLVAGGAVRPSTVIQLHDTNNAVLGLRSELTASIARAAVTRLADVVLPQRLYYHANVFRRLAQGTRHRQQELYQSGVELLGAASTMADGEIILLLADCLNTLGLRDWHLVLGEAELTRSLLDPFPEQLRHQVRLAIAQLDRLALEDMALGEGLKELALTLFDLRGTPEAVLKTVSSLDLTPSQKTIIQKLTDLVDLLSTGCTAQPPDTPSSGAAPMDLPAFTLDLSLIRPFDYYTGIVFEVINQTATGYNILAQGGRYDTLLELYHPQGKDVAGIGFVINVDDVQKLLAPRGHLPQTTPSSDWLVVPTSSDATSAAFAYAQRLRQSATLIRVEVALESVSRSDSSGADRETIRQSARTHQITKIAWIDADGTPDIETL